MRSLELSGLRLSVVSLSSFLEVGWREIFGDSWVGGERGALGSRLRLDVTSMV